MATDTGRPNVILMSKASFVADVLLVSRQELSSLRCPFLRAQNTSLFKYLVIECIHTRKVREYFLRLNKDDETLVLPYPSYGHLDA